MNTSIMWSATLISLCLEFSTTPFLRKSLYMNESSNICAVVVGMTFIYQKRNHFLHILLSFMFAALPSVILTVTFLRAAGNIHPAQRLQWRPRGPVVKQTLSSNVAICTHADRRACTSLGRFERKLALVLHKWSPRCSF